MKTAMVLMMAVMVFVGLSAAAFGEEIRTLNISESDWPPYNFLAKPGAPKGIIKEIFEMCVPPSEYRLKFEFYPVKRMFTYLEEGKIDMNVLSYKKRTRILSGLWKRTDVRQRIPSGHACRKKYSDQHASGF
ncbi:MAG: amino acid ABC transporter substrate-binding protein [Desulfobacteraceae bacterium]|nr:amino acid ABC transporter substrate-binding protein [Desulfobacteraceae bacterium]